MFCCIYFNINYNLSILDRNLVSTLYVYGIDVTTYALPHEPMYTTLYIMLFSWTLVHIVHKTLQYTNTLQEWIKFMNILPCMLCVNVMFFSGKMVVFEYELCIYNTQARDACMLYIRNNVCTFYIYTWPAVQMNNGKKIIIFLE